MVSRLQQTVTSQEQSLELAYSLLDRQRDELDDAQATVRQLQAQQHLAGVATDIQQSGMSQPHSCAQSAQRIAAELNSLAEQEPIVRAMSPLHSPISTV